MENRPANAQKWIYLLIYLTTKVYTHEFFSAKRPRKLIPEKVLEITRRPRNYVPGALSSVSNMCVPWGFYPLGLWSAGAFTRWGFYPLGLLSVGAFFDGAFVRGAFVRGAFVRGAFVRAPLFYVRFYLVLISVLWIFILFCNFSFYLHGTTTIFYTKNKQSIIIITIIMSPNLFSIYVHTWTVGKESLF